MAEGTGNSCQHYYCYTCLTHSLSAVIAAVLSENNIDAHAVEVNFFKVSIKWLMHGFSGLMIYFTGKLIVKVSITLHS